MTEAPDLIELFDVRGYRRSPATMPGFHQGRPPRNKGRRYPPDMPTAEEMVRLLSACPPTPSGRRGRALIATLWRTGMRIHEALLLEERDLDSKTHAILIRRGKGGKRHTVGMDEWGWLELDAWLEERRTYPVGPVFCVVDGPTAGTRAMGGSSARALFRHLVQEAGVRRRVHPHALRHAFAVELMREGVSVHVLQRQLGHANLGITSEYLRSISADEIVETVAARPAPAAPIPHLEAAR